MTISSHLSELDSLSADTTAGKIAELKRRREAAAQPMGEKAHEKVHAQGRLTARERLDYLLDEGSFVETDMLAVHRTTDFGMGLSLIHISEPTRLRQLSRMPSSA